MEIISKIKGWAAALADVGVSRVSWFSCYLGFIFNIHKEVDHIKIV